MSEYTKGPWKLKPARNMHYTAKVKGRDYEATMQKCYYVEGEQHDIHVDTFVADIIIDPGMEANANLIKAAPDMYEFIASLGNDDNQMPGFMWDLRNTVLRKAEGIDL